MRTRRFSNASEEKISEVSQEVQCTRNVLKRYFERNKTKIDAVARGLGVTGGLNGILSELLKKE